MLVDVVSHAIVMLNQGLQVPVPRVRSSGGLGHGWIGCLRVGGPSPWAFGLWIGANTGIEANDGAWFVGSHADTRIGLEAQPCDER